MSCAARSRERAQTSASGTMRVHWTSRNEQVRRAADGSSTNLTKGTRKPGGKIAVGIASPDGAAKDT
jgi:hypothetical protein